MVVTSAVCWFFFTVLISLFCDRFTSAGKMSYGLVYRPAGLYSGSSTTTTTTTTATPRTTEKTKIEANETAISIQTEHPPDNANTTTIIINKITRNNVTTDLDGKFTENDILPWLMQSAANPPYKPAKSQSQTIGGGGTHQYQVTEDAEPEASAQKHKAMADARDHQKNTKKKHDVGAFQHHHKEEKKKGKEGKEVKKTQHASNGGKKNQHVDKKHHKGESDKREKSKKKMKHKSGKKLKHDYSEKGFEDKYKYDKQDKVDKFWHNHEEKGEFHKFGRKKNMHHKDEEKKKKNSKKKKGRTMKKSKKEGKKGKKEGSKEDSGYKAEKDTKHTYSHHAEFEKKAKSKSNKDKKND